MKTDERSRKRTKNQRKKESRCHKAWVKVGASRKQGQM